MTKKITDYSIEIHASVGSGLIAQILFENENIFVGRIDFYRDVTPPVSYLWHPTSTTDENQIYLVLAMPADLFPVITELIRTEKPWSLELWPSGPLIGASTDGYGGTLNTSKDQLIGEEVVEARQLLRAVRS
ncbi:MAG TPA: hypothetical protein VL832_11885 [Puia sp.]|nr:hypothetical protein [Puia sp.]